MKNNSKWITFLLTATIITSTTTITYAKQKNKTEATTQTKNEVLNTIEELLKTPEFTDAEKNTLNGTKLQDAFKQTYHDLYQGTDLKTDLRISINNKNIDCCLDTSAKAKVKSTLQYNTETKKCKINAGKDYGAIEIKLSIKTQENIEQNLSELHKQYPESKSQPIQFIYNTTCKLNLENKSIAEEGTYQVIINGKTTTEKYSNKDDKIRAAANLFWPLAFKTNQQVIDESSGPSDESKIEDFEKATKNLQKTEGTFTLYQKKQEILLELPKKDLGKIWMAQAAIHSSNGDVGLSPGTIIKSLSNAGPVSFGDHLALQAYKWEKRGDNLCLVVPNTKHRWNDKTPLAEAAKYTFVEPIIASYPIEQEHPEKELYLINITPFFRGDVHELQRYIDEAAGAGFMPDIPRNTLDTIKHNEDLTLIRMNLHYIKPGNFPQSHLFNMMQSTSPLYNKHTDTRSLPLKVSFNIWYRKDTGYTPRLADKRVGYFTLDHVDLQRSAKHDPTVKYITRCNLQKKDPTAALSEPVRPIIFTLFNVPTEYKKSVTDGVLLWNKAFEKIGFKNALQVQDAPTNPDWDHTDVRYNVIRWTLEDCPMAAAYSPPLVDPFTGEILSSSIHISPAAIQHITNGYSKLKNTPLAKTINSETDIAKLAKELTEKISPKNISSMHICNHALESATGASLAYFAKKTGVFGDTINKEEFLNKYLTSLVVHEVGHTLGLTHNFTAQNYRSFEELANEELMKNEGLSASVMEYKAPNPVAIANGKSHIFDQTIGKYDIWAIEYGYKPLDAISTEGEKPALLKIASRSGEKGLAYMGDLDMLSPNPYVAHNTLGNDPIKFAQLTNSNAKRTLEKIATDFTKSGKDTTKDTQAIFGLIQTPYMTSFNLLKFIGGMETSKSLPTDPDAKPILKPIDAATQRRALNHILKESLSPTSLNLPEKTLHNLGVNYRLDQQHFATWNAPIRSVIHMMQLGLAASLVTPEVISKIQENEFKTKDPKKAYTVTEHYRTITNSIFEELNKKGDITPLRRDLQRAVTKLLVMQAGNEGGWFMQDASETRLITQHELKRVQNMINLKLKDTTLSELNVLHLKDMNELITKSLNKTYTLATN